MHRSHKHTSNTQMNKDSTNGHVLLSSGWTFVFPRNCDAWWALLSWKQLKTCLTMGSKEWISFFALLVCTVFALPSELSLSQPMSSHTFLPFWFSSAIPPGEGEWAAVWFWAVCQDWTTTMPLSLMPPCPSVSSLLLLPKSPIHLPFPVFGSSSKHPIISHVQSQNTLLLYPIMCLTLLDSSDPLVWERVIALLGHPGRGLGRAFILLESFIWVSTCCCAHLVSADGPLMSSGSSTAGSYLILDIVTHDIFFLSSFVNVQMSFIPWANSFSLLH